MATGEGELILLYIYTYPQSERHILRKYSLQKLNYEQKNWYY